MEDRLSSSSPRPIVVGVDGSIASRTALQWAVHQAEFTHAPIEIICAWQHPATYDRTKPWPEEADFESAARRVLEDCLKVVADSDRELNVTTKVLQGHPSPTLVDHSRSASLVVVGSRRHGEFTGMLLGSVGLFLTAHAHCPVVVVRGDEPVLEAEQR